MVIRSGQKFTLDSLKNGQTKIIVASGWMSAQEHDLDVDFSAFFCSSEHTVTSLSDFVFYNNPTTYDSGVKLEHRNFGFGEDDTITIDLSCIPTHIKNIYFTVSLGGYPSLSFNKHYVTTMYVRLIDQFTQQELVRFSLEDNFTAETAIITSQLAQVDGQWCFLALGNGVGGGLQALCNDFGIEV